MNNNTPNSENQGEESGLFKVVQSVFMSPTDAIIETGLSEEKAIELAKSLNINSDAYTDYLVQSITAPQPEAATREGEESKWIRVKDRLPDNGQEVWGTINRNLVKSILTYKEQHFDGKNLFVNHDYPFGIRNITHWQPLPTPPNQ